MLEKLKVANKFARAASIESGRGLVITLDYEGRFLRRKRLLSDTGEPFLVDLAETVSLDHGDVFICDDGTEITICAAIEPVIEIRHETCFTNSTYVQYIMSTGCLYLLYFYLFLRLIFL